MIPQLRVWHEKYEKAGLTIVGVHTPEFFWEKSHTKVAGAVKDFGIRYPVVQDNDWAIWRRFGVWAWPTTILVDRQGIVRYRHIGEGAYGETEAMIRRLLAEGSADGLPQAGANETRPVQIDRKAREGRKETPRIQTADTERPR